MVRRSVVHPRGAIRLADHFLNADPWHRGAHNEEQGEMHRETVREQRPRRHNELLSSINITSRGAYLPRARAAERNLQTNRIIRYLHRPMCTSLR